MVAIAPELKSPPTPESPSPPPLQAEVHSLPEQRITYCDRTWEQFKLIEQGLEGLNGLRLFYFDGKVEIFMPGKNHELFTEVIAILIQAFLLVRNLEFLPTGSMTRENEGSASAEPDKSYEFGEFKLAIEVIATSGSMNKLNLYKTLGFHEVWFWEDGLLEIYHLYGEDYKNVDRSQIPELADINIEIFSKCVLIGETSRVKACEEFLAAHPKP